MNPATSSRWLVAAASLLVASGCAGGLGGRSPAGAERAIHRGIVTFGPTTGVGVFQPCGSREALWVSAGAELLGDPDAPIERFVVVEGTLQPEITKGPDADYSGAIAIENLLYAFVQEGAGCDFEWSAFHYRARGNEPFWMLEVTDNGMRLVRPNAPDEMWRDVERTETPEGLVFRSRSGAESHPPADAVEHDAELIIRRESCIDSMSGAYFGLSAELRLDDQIFTGCTLVGAPPQ